MNEVSAISALNVKRSNDGEGVPYLRAGASIRFTTVFADVDVVVNNVDNRFCSLVVHLDWASDVKACLV